MLFAPQQSPLDLGFPIGRIPVRVTPSFWLGSAFMGFGLEDPGLIFVWVLTVFVSVLIHELGHALMWEAFGYPSEIVLYHFGGVALAQSGWNMAPWRSLLVSLAGPGIGFVFYGLLISAGPLLAPHLTDRYPMAAYQFLLYQNLAWGLLNLAPVLPLDGGQALRSLLQMAGLRSAGEWTVKISVFAAGALALWFAQMGAQYAAILLGILCLNNIQAWTNRQYD